MQFYVHTEGIALDAYIRRHRSEVQTQRALVVLTPPHRAVVTKNSLNITSIICVLKHNKLSFRNTLGLTQGALRTTEESETGLRSNA